jgi:purine nucleoside phosphorylase
LIPATSAISRAISSSAVSFALINFAAGVSAQKLSDKEVLATGKKAAPDFARLLQAGLSA